MGLKLLKKNTVSGPRVGIIVGLFVVLLFVVLLFVGFCWSFCCWPLCRLSMPGCCSLVGLFVGRLAGFQVHRNCFQPTFVCLQNRSGSASLNLLFLSSPLVYFVVCLALCSRLVGICVPLSVFVPCLDGAFPSFRIDSFFLSLWLRGHCRLVFQSLLCCLDFRILACRLWTHPALSSHRPQCFDYPVDRLPGRRRRAPTDSGCDPPSQPQRVL